MFFLRLVYFLFLLFLTVFLSRFRLQEILAPLSGGIALIVFIYGIIQKFFLFPWILGQPGWDQSLYSQALRDQGRLGPHLRHFPAADPVRHGLRFAADFHYSLFFSEPGLATDFLVCPACCWAGSICF